MNPSAAPAAKPALEAAQPLPKIAVPDSCNYIGVFLSMNCPRGCSYCMNNRDSNARGKPLASGKQWVEHLNRLETALPLTLHGGEPMTHPDFYFILKNLKPELKLDMLSTFPSGVKEFIARADPQRFRRDLPYPSIRITNHFETMDLEQTVKDAKALVDAGFDAGLCLVDVPWDKPRVDRARDYIKSNGIRCTIKPYLGRHGGKLYGQFRYGGACDKAFRKDVECRGDNLLLASDGKVYRCYADLFNSNGEGVIGDFFSPEFRIEEKFRACGNFGHCAWCDVQDKYDRFGRPGYCAVKIRGWGVKEVEHKKIDWR